MCARVGGQPMYTLGNDEKQLLNFRCSKKEMNGEELFIRSCPCALKLKLKYKEERFKDNPTADGKKKRNMDK